MCVGSPPKEPCNAGGERRRKDEQEERCRGESRDAGRRVALLHASARGSRMPVSGGGREGVDVRKEVEELIELSEETQMVSLLIVNEVGEGQVALVRELNTSLVLGQDGMPVALSSLIALRSDTAIKSEVRRSFPKP